MIVECSALIKTFTPSPLKLMEHCGKGGRKNVRTRRYGEAIQNSIFWAGHSYCNHKLRAVADDCRHGWRRGPREPYLPLLIYLLIDLGKGVVSAFSCVPIGDPLRL